MTKFTNSKNYNNQLATAYIVYMMGGSYFKNCECKNKLEEKRLFLHYAEMPQQKQIRAEEKFLQKLDRLDRDFLTQMEEMKGEVRFLKTNLGYDVEFQTGGFGVLRCKVNERGEVEVNVGRA